MTTGTATSRDRATHRARYLGGLVWHAGTFLIINGFFWVLDAITGNGITWAVWISLMWGLALAYHALACYVDGRGTEAAAVETFTEHRSSDHHTV